MLVRRPGCIAAIRLACGVLATALGGCSAVGVTSINAGRTPYNEAIQNTSEEQTLLNLVRARDDETPFFMDVSEVDQATTVIGSIAGGPSAIGAAANPRTTSGTFSGAVGAVTGTASYQEAPTVRYIPLLGAALIAQVSTPINADSIVNLYDSGWPLGAIFDLAVGRFTPGYDEYFPALNALLELDRYGTIVLAADDAPRKADAAPSARDLSVTVSQTVPTSKADASLKIYFHPENLRRRFERCDVADRTGEMVPLPEEEARARRLWERVTGILGQRGRNPVVLDVKPDPKKAAQPPSLRTRSALGAMRNASQGDNLVLFDTKEAVDAIIAHNFPRGVGISRCHEFFYELDNRYLPFDDKRFTSVEFGAKLSAAQMEEERTVGSERRLILVQRTAERPEDGFAATYHEGYWYSIQNRDFVSKRNLALVAQINTIQAVPSTSAPLTPTIVVGARQ